MHLTVPQAVYIIGRLKALSHKSSEIMHLPPKVTYFSCVLDFLSQAGVGDYLSGRIVRRKNENGIMTAYELSPNNKHFLLYLQFPSTFVSSIIYSHDLHQGIQHGWPVLIHHLNNLDLNFSKFK